MLKNSTSRKINDLAHVVIQSPENMEFNPSDSTLLKIMQFAASYRSVKISDDQILSLNLN